MNIKALVITISLFLSIGLIATFLPLAVGYFSDYLLNLNVNECNSSFSLCFTNGWLNFFLYLIQTLLQIVPLTIIWLAFYTLMRFISSLVHKTKFDPFRSQLHDEHKATNIATWIISIVIPLIIGIFLNEIIGAVFSLCFPGRFSNPVCNFDTYFNVMNSSCFANGIAAGAILIGIVAGVVLISFIAGIVYSKVVEMVKKDDLVVVGTPQADPSRDGGPVRGVPLEVRVAV